VLIVRFGGIGDILLSTPMARSLYEAFPSVAIDYVVGRGLRQTLEGLPYVRSIFEFDKRWSKMSPPYLMDFRDQLCKVDYDCYFNLQPSIKTRLIGALISARKQVVFAKDRAKQENGHVRHAIHDFLKELRHVDVAPTASAQMDFVVPDDARSSVDRILGYRPDRKLVIVNPCATRPINRWPARRFAEVCDALSVDPSLDIAYVGSKRGRYVLADFRRSLKHADRLIDTSNKLTIKELGALIARADVMLTGDTGPMHIASALNRPIVCLSGAADPDRTGPLNPDAVVLIDRSLGCVSCQRKTCYRGFRPVCMSNLSVERVERAVKDALGAPEQIQVMVS
jgi:lipopolysaccharide heptosyltransferase II